MFVRSRSNLNVQVLFLRREKIGAPAEKLLKAMTKNTNKLKKHMVLQESLWLLGVDVGTCNEHKQQWREARAFNIVLTLPSYNIPL